MAFVGNGLLLGFVNFNIAVSMIFILCILDFDITFFLCNLDLMNFLPWINKRYKQTSFFILITHLLNYVVERRGENRI